MGERRNEKIFYKYQGKKLFSFCLKILLLHCNVLLLPFKTEVDLISETSKGTCLSHGFTCHSIQIKGTQMDSIFCMMYAIIVQKSMQKL